MTVDNLRMDGQLLTNELPKFLAVMSKRIHPTLLPRSLKTVLDLRIIQKNYYFQIVSPLALAVRNLQLAALWWSVEVMKAVGLTLAFKSLVRASNK
jgi:hypothetical protein